MIFRVLEFRQSPLYGHRRHQREDSPNLLNSFRLESSYSHSPIFDPPLSQTFVDNHFDCTFAEYGYPAMPEYVYARHDFLPENSDEISFHAGEAIEVIEKDDIYSDGWWQVSRSFYSQGLADGLL